MNKTWSDYMDKKEIIKLSVKYAPEMIRLRRELHQHPEIALEERQTQKIISDKLREIGLKVNTKIWKTSVIGLLDGKGKTVGIRSDMDALPVTEQTGYSFTSKNPGKMHACGHDVHMATVWGAARILSDLKSELKGAVKFIYQPSEEVHPGGARPLIDAGVLKKPDVSMMFGLHVDSTIPAGTIGIKDGPMMAQADDFSLEIIGRSGHGARPHETIDAVIVASNVVLALQNIASRQVNPLVPVVVSIGAIHGGTATNVIADRVVLKGTARSLTPELTAVLPRMIEKIVTGVCVSFGAKFELRYNRGYPVLFNDKGVNEVYRDSARELFGKKAIVEIAQPSMGGEDFSYFTRAVPGAMIRLGVGNKRIGANKPWHHPAFKVDEAAIPFGAAVLSHAVRSALQDKIE
jgi:amidohydrolase